MEKATQFLASITDVELRLFVEALQERRQNSTPQKEVVEPLLEFEKHIRSELKLDESEYSDAPYITSQQLAEKYINNEVHARWLRTLATHD